MYFIFAIRESILLIAIYSFICLIQDTSALSCMICAEGNLNEFGDCSNVFEHDCSTYEKRNPNQNVLCRTTRNRSNNGTYTIIKECITESAHYATFSNTKAFKLEEECDVVDVDGVEVAYCLCKTNDFCNRPPIVDQFTSFENKYPEFFDPLIEAKPEDGITEFPHSTTLLQEKEKNSEFEFDSETKNHLENDFNTFNAAETQLKQAAEREILTTKYRSNASNFGQPPISPSSAAIVPIVNSNRNSVVHSANIFSNDLPFSSQGLLPNFQTEKLSCMQCSEADLANINSDCASQVVVNCPKPAPGTGRSLCFSRQIITLKEEFGVEKMCVPEKAVLEEFGDDAVLDGCQSIESDSIVSRYCVCSTPKCNRASVNEQVLFGKTKSSELTSSTTVGDFSPKHTNVPQNFEISDGLSCAVCLDTELKSAMEDCRSVKFDNCLYADGEKGYCLTRQTQNGKDSFIIEKRCVLQKEFLDNFPEEKKFMIADSLTSKCASTYDGYVNFCICDGNMCNKESLPRQAEKMASRSMAPPLEASDRLNIQGFQPASFGNKFNRPELTRTTEESRSRFSAELSTTRYTTTSLPTSQFYFPSSTDPTTKTTKNAVLLNNNINNQETELSNHIDETNERLERWKAASIATSNVPDSALSLFTMPSFMLRMAGALLCILYTIL